MKREANKWEKSFDKSAEDVGRAFKTARENQATSSRGIGGSSEAGTK